jgi:hypothetical protein
MLRYAATEVPAGTPADNVYVLLSGSSTTSAGVAHRMTSKASTKCSQQAPSASQVGGAYTARNSHNIRSV